jgi:cytochrome P450
MGTKAEEFDAAMRHTLTRNTPTVLASFTAEVDYAIQQNIGACNDWTAIVCRGAMSRVASLMSGRAFVGLPLSREHKWVEASVNYTGDVSRAWMVLRFTPWFIRPFIAPLLPQVRSLKRQRETNEQMLAPLLADKMEQNVKGKEKKAIPGGEMIDWFRAQYKGKPTVAEIGRDQLLATFASIYNLSNALTYAVFDLAAHPECIEPLRAELNDVLGEDGVIDKHTLLQLRKLDSFAKESQRLSPPSLGE